MIISSVQKNKETPYKLAGKKRQYTDLKLGFFCIKINFVSLSAMHVNLSLAVEMTILSVFIVKRFLKNYSIGNNDRIDFDWVFILL